MFDVMEWCARCGWHKSHEILPDPDGARMRNEDVMTFEMTFSDMIRALRSQDIRIVGFGLDRTDSKGAKRWLVEDLASLYNYWVPLPKGWV